MVAIVERLLLRRRHRSSRQYERTLMRFVAIATALCLGMFAATVAPATAGASAAKSEAQATVQPAAHPSAKKKARHHTLDRKAVVAKVKAQGYRSVRDVRRAGPGAYTAVARTKHGRTVALRINAYTGAVISVRRA